MKLFKEYLKKEKKELDKNNVKLISSGSRDGVNKDLLEEMDNCVEFLQKNNGITLNLAFNYGGRREIIEAVNKVIAQNKEKISEEDFSEYLYHGEVPDPELVIRTSGEFRISNFLLWEIAYSEFYITEKMWPEFSEDEFENAVDYYRKRDRRFGGV